MILYKYFPPERIDVIENLKIRFTQPAIYNDPFELNPIMNSNITEEVFNQVIPVLVRYSEGSIAAIEALQKTTYKYFQANPKEILSLIQKFMTVGSLALCLTEIPDSLLMWAHYADCHRGFVVGFDSLHHFFTCPYKSYYLKQVQYQHDRPSVTLPNPSSDDTYFTKSIEWVYEKEWRLFRNLPNGKTPEQFLEKDFQNFPIYLFDFPSEIIKEVILGCRIDPALREGIKKLINKNFKHVLIRQATLSDNQYSLQFISAL